MYVIAGVSGNTGSIVANALLEQGKKVRVIVRDAKKGEAWKARGAEVAVASVDDEDALTKALEGATGAYLLSPPDMGSQDFIEEKRAPSRRSRAPSSAARSRTSSSCRRSGAQHEAGTGTIRTVHFGEERLAKTPAKTTFVRAAYFLDNWASVLGAAAQGKLPTFLPPDLVVPMVSTKDIGLVAAKALLEPPSGKTEIIELAGPRDYSSRELAAVLGKNRRQAGRGRRRASRGGGPRVHELRHQREHRRALPGDVRGHRERCRRVRGQGRAPRARQRRRRGGVPCARGREVELEARSVVATAART